MQHLLILTIVSLVNNPAALRLKTTSGIITSSYVKNVTKSGMKDDPKNHIVITKWLNEYHIKLQAVRLQCMAVLSCHSLSVT